MKRLWVTVALLIGVITGIAIIEVHNDLTWSGRAVAVITLFCAILAFLYAWQWRDE